jgi:hypothetical protein
MSMNAAHAAKSATFHVNFQNKDKTCYGGLFEGHQREIQITVYAMGHGFWEVISTPEYGFRSRVAAGEFMDMDDPTEIMEHIRTVAPHAMA